MDANHDLVNRLKFDVRGNTSDLLAEKIRTLILSGELSAGYIFPNETLFCEQLGVGRSTLREAYKSLESTGFIRRVKHTGTVVNGFSDISKASPISTSLLMSNFDELMEFRVMIEAEIARLAAQRATRENTDRIAFFLDKMRANTEDLQELTRYDTCFHMEIAKASGNRILESTMENTKELFQDGVYHAFQIDTEVNVQEALRLHSEILFAIGQKDSVSAYALMRQHVESVNYRIETEQKK